MGRLSEAVEDLNSMVLAMPGVEKDPCGMELLEVLRGLGIDPGSGPDQAAVDATLRGQ